MSRFEAVAGLLSRAGSLACTAFFCFGLSGCGTKPIHDPKMLMALMRDSRAILERQRSDDNLEVAKRTWPKSIRSIAPLSVITTRDGLYATMDSFLVNESGYFVPRKNTHVDSREGRETTFSP